MNLQNLPQIVLRLHTGEHLLTYTVHITDEQRMTQAGPNYLVSTSTDFETSKAYWRYIDQSRLIAVATYPHPSKSRFIR